MGQQSTELVDFLDAHYQQADLLASSSLAWVKVSRAVLAGQGAN